MQAKVKMSVIVSVVVIISFATGFLFCGGIGFMLGAIVGEGPGIAEEHADRNQIVFGVIGGVWLAFLLGRFVFYRLRKD